MSEVAGSFQIAALKRVTPSGFTSLSKCLLRAAYLAGGQSAQLPQSPVGALGTLAHKLFELAAIGGARGTKTEFDVLWEQLVHKEESAMLTSSLQRRFVPLRDSAPRYDVLKLQACKQAAEIVPWIQRGAGIREGSSVHRASLQIEKWVETPDGKVAGRIDYASESTGGTVLRDYKTGTLRECGSMSTDQSHPVKEEYITQMMLYAGLWHSAKGTWPTRLELRTMDGETAEVPFSTAQCLALLDEAKEALEQANRSIHRALACSPPDLTSLASPHPEVCGFCTFRPICDAYWKSRESTGSTLDGAGSTWPVDMRGSVTAKQILGNKRIMITLLRTGGSKITIRFGPQTERHPGLAQIKVGTLCAVYNLKCFAPDSSVYDDTLYTLLDLQH